MIFTRNALSVELNHPALSRLDADALEAAMQKLLADCEARGVPVPLLTIIENVQSVILRTVIGRYVWVLPIPK